MLFFFHLFVGLCVGCLLAVLFKNKWAVLFTGLGGVICDLLDKPLGHIFLSGSINDGRIFSHTLLFFFILLMLGVILWKINHKRVFFLCLSTGVLLHQLGDEMWAIPHNWFWPLFGPFEDSTYNWPALPDWFMVVAEIAIAAAGCALGIYCAAVIYKLLYRRVKKAVSVILSAAAFLAAAFGFHYFIRHVFLEGPWADYFGTMLQHELLTASEYICGIGSVILILLVIAFPFTFSKGLREKILGAYGIFCIAAAVVSAVLLLFGIQVEMGYGNSVPALLLSFAGLVLCGGILFGLRKKCADVLE
ncbi:MAG TPA: metal-dependent hydrolase [Methanocorpusculum sp.]|nr:metal-dependent hydrolase [Methanocorpusculum sp.]